MIDALRARQIASDMISAKAQKQIEEVEKEIVTHAEKGELMCSHDGWILPQVETYLMSLGYRVKQDSGRNESWTNIYWSAEKVC